MGVLLNDCAFCFCVLRCCCFLWGDEFPRVHHSLSSNTTFHSTSCHKMYRGNDAGSRGGAEHLARIHGTEEDKVNCPFYFKIGACRHGDKCSRQHHKPPFSQTIIVPHMWAVSSAVMV